MSSFAGSDDPALSLESAEPHVVVACPSCQTKFAVESSAVAALEVPRFHCSRCDNIFVMKDSDRSMSSNSTANIRQLGQQISSADNDTPRWTLSDPDKFIGDLSDKTPANNPAQMGVPKPAVMKSALKTGDFSIGFQPHSPPSGLTQLTQTESISLESGFSLLAQGQLNIRAHSPANGPEPIPSAHFRSPESASSHFELTNPQAKPVARSSYVTPSYNNASIPTPGREPHISAENERELLELGRTDPRSGLFTRLFATLSEHSKGLVALSAPLLALVLVLVGLSYSARISPRSIGALFDILLPSIITRSTPELPPSNLAVRDISLKFVRTRTRETVAIVTGSVLNATGQNFDGVTIEALGFNERGEIIVSSHAPLHSALARERISDLELSTVSKFQHALGARSASIAPNEGVPFTIALLNDESASAENEPLRALDLSKVKYFSARVFSVE